MTETAHQLNGPSSPSGKFIDSINPDDPEYIRQLQRPAVVKEDVKQMEDRRRVSIVLNSEAFREELEQIVHEHMKAGHHPASLALQQITELLMPHSSYRSNNTGFKASPVIPILDIRGMESLGYSRQEKILRCKLASCYRLIDIFGWSHGIFNHITARINQEQEHFLLNPFGLLFSEMTASSLVKVDMQGEIVDTGSTCMGINKAGFMLHSAIHQARPDIRCIIHLHTPHAVAVSAMKCGLLPLSQESLICGTISYHEYNGIIVDQDEREKLARSLGPANKVMFLRNHGIVACGETVEEAYHFAFNVMKACDTQINALPAGLDNLVLVDEESQKKTFAIAGQSGGGGVDTSGRKWKTGELEFEALMRMMDNSGFRTGYIYRNPLIKQEKDHTNSDIEIPPTSSSFTYVYDGEVDRSKYVSPLRTALERQKQQQYKAGWLTSPNTYKKQEIDEIGTTHPKKITKWVPENSESTKSVNVKIEKANQFAPQGENPKEFRDKQKQIRKDYYEERVHAGPQSKVLEGSTWEDAQKMKDGNLSSASDSVVMIGAASKGIIRRDHQHNAIVYKSLYSPNPFENVSEDELAKYKEKVEGKLIEADSEDTEPAPDGRLISTEERMQQIRSDGVDLKTEAEAAVPRGSRDDIHGSIPTVTVTPVSAGEKRDDEKLGSPAKSDTLRSTDSASGGETLDDRSSKEGSPTKENPSPTKKGKKKNIFRIRSFNKKKKEIKE
ncbi:gamma-adducin-like isoform X2 [Argonauta hians]